MSFCFLLITEVPFKNIRNSVDSLYEYEVKDIRVLVNCGFAAIVCKLYLSKTRQPYKTTSDKLRVFEMCCLWAIKKVRCD